jgi:hypothetical protein
METIEYVNPKIDRSKWLKGAWDGEPDKKQWQDTDTELPCLAVRHPRSGHWCGYVGVPNGHPAYGKDYDDVDVEVWWGLTFADKCQEVENECAGICHKAPAGEDDVWWLGFDCAHYNDHSPEDVVRSRDSEYPFTISDTSSYKALRFVEEQCKRLAKQLKSIADRASKGTNP